MDYTNLPDNEIVSAVQNGWLDAYSELIVRYRDKVFRTVNGMICNYEDARDITQEVFYKAFIHLDKFRGEAMFSTWIYRIAVNMSKNYFRRANRQTNNVDENFFNCIKDENVAEAGSDIEDMELLRILYQALDKIDYRYRGVLILKEINQLPYDEIAEVTGLDIGTVKSRVYRAKAKLKELLKNKIPAYV
ncbi:MAG: RNA polymerase sigma factor [Candidatus Margulisbacteria bacterium]|nr:RNA polymerase sigma factor [Candidatus Margulisiibacteriota bacterium]